MTAPKTAAEHIDALMAIHPKGFDLSLERITGLLAKLDNPQDKLPSIIHVAGTNGKGSTVAFTRAILEAAGLAVHVDTSPHLVNWHERYRIGKKGEPGQLVDDATLADAIDRVAKANDGQAITVFEVLTVVAFLLFAEHPADVALIEVGLGGRFDSTNVMSETALTVITPVSIDHEAFLGDTLAKIAFEKAGIIKRRTPVIIGPQDQEALDVIEKQAGRNLAPVFISGQDFSAFEENGRIIFQDSDQLLDLDLPNLPGTHQISNAATAIASCLKFCGGQGIELTDAMIERGLKEVNWPGRMQRLQGGKLFDFAPKGSEIWLDGGHNPGAAEMVAGFMSELNHANPRPLVLICGMLNTKDPSGYFGCLAACVDQVICVPILSSEAGIDPEELAAIAAQSGMKAKAEVSLTNALQEIEESEIPRVLIAGSLYLVGDALSKNGTPPK